jgi:orotate phosphoribosyltransferase-like protein
MDNEGMVAKIKSGQAIVQDMIEAARARRRKALELRNSGLTVQQVGERLGVSKQKASELITRARKESQAI